MANGIPDPPDDFGLDGRRVWARCWGEAITWLSLDSDGEQIEHLCRTADDLAAARRRYRVTTEPADARALAMLSKQMTEGLSAIGFNPTARARLGLAEVKAQDAIEQILHRRKTASS